MNGQKPPRGFTRLRRFELHEVLPHIGLDRQWFEAGDRRVSVRLKTQRMLLMGREQRCACCDLKGLYFWLEYSGYYSPHFNMYGVNDNGHEVMLTCDHIKPRCMGGHLSPANVQLLCVRCNAAKKNDPITLKELWDRVFKSPPSAAISRVGEWVSQGELVGQIDRLDRTKARVRLWCACLDRERGGKNPSRLWHYGTFRTMSVEQVHTAKEDHLYCPPANRFGKGIAELRSLVGHLQRPAIRLWVPKVVLESA